MGAPDWVIENLTYEDDDFDDGSDWYEYIPQEVPTFNGHPIDYDVEGNVKTYA